jgi:hypothetical protein
VWRRKTEAGKRSTIWWRKKRGDAREQIRQREWMRIGMVLPVRGGKKETAGRR